MASVTIRDVPDDVRDELASRAARAGQSLQEHLRATLIELAAKPTPHDLMVEVSATKRELGSHLDAGSILAHRHSDRRRQQSAGPPAIQRWSREMPVVDASAIVSALVDSGPVGRWAETVVASGALSAPDLLAYEVANVLRRSEASGEITTEVAVLAHRNLDRLRIDLYPYASFASRAWELRRNLTIHDAAYVALAERLSSPSTSSTVPRWSEARSHHSRACTAHAVSRGARLGACPTMLSSASCCGRK